MKSLIPFRPGNQYLDQMQNEIEEMFHRFFGAPAERKTNGMQAWTPKVDISETDKEFIVKADLPGVEPKDVEVSVRDGMMTLSGEKREQREEKQKNYHRTERFVGQFFRSIPLPAGVDEDKVAASSGKGVLTVTIPKKPEAEPKKIAIKSEE